MNEPEESLKKWLFEMYVEVAIRTDEEAAQLHGACSGAPSEEGCQDFYFCLYELMASDRKRAPMDETYGGLWEAERLRIAHRIAEIEALEESEDEDAEQCAVSA